jgi:hypothetical protein
MSSKLKSKLLTWIPLVAVLVIIAGITFNVWIYTKPDNTIPTIPITTDSKETPSNKPNTSVSEEEWKKQYEEELNEARKEVENANNRFRIAEEEKAALADELGITKDELDKAKADLQLLEVPQLDTLELNEKYSKVGELVTLNYEYEYISKATDNGKALSIFGSGDLIFWDTKEFLYRIPGNMKLGVDVSGIHDGITIDESSKTISIKIPKAYVISNDFDEQNVERYDMKKGWLNSNPVTDEDLLQAFSGLESELNQKVNDNGMLKYAQDLAGSQIKELLEPIASASKYKIQLAYAQ